MIFGGSNNRHLHGTTFGSCPDFYKFYTVRLLGKFVPVLEKLHIVAQEIIISDRVFAEYRFRDFQVLYRQICRKDREGSQCR
ncbi:hypothetical protein Barb7_02220 [Bacteroidales bacterium Barb7]|nr:hypothetical protein Barb7_02220 [Bacteroidales bacterium Barb7]